MEKCQVTEKTLYKLNISSIETIKNPSFGNSIMQISSDFGFKGKNFEKFLLLFRNDTCFILANDEKEKKECSTFSDFLYQGLEQCVSKLNSMFGTIIEELESINSNRTKFKEIINNSNFHNFEKFLEYYYEIAVFYTEEIFKDLHSEKLNTILNIMYNVIIFYIIIILASFLILIYLIYSFHKTINTFLYFIGILPFKFLLEDEKFYKEIILFGNKYFGSN